MEYKREVTREKLKAPKLKAETMNAVTPRSPRARPSMLGLVLILTGAGLLLFVLGAGVVVFCQSHL